MRAVVTGAAGFIGRSLVRKLAGRGEVVGIDRLPQAPEPGVIQLTADLLDDERVRDALAHADVVFHLAGCPDVRDPRPDADWRRYRDNVLATEVVLANASPRTRVVITSSSSIYGGATLSRPSTERDEPEPRGGYATSKLTMEQHCQAQLAAGGDILVVRPFTVAGEGQRPGMALSRWITAIQAGAPVRILGSPARSRDITDVTQVVTALTQLAGTQARGIVNLGTGVGQTLREMVTAVERAVGMAARYEVVSAAREEVEHTLANTDKLRSLLGWVPETDLDALVARQAAAMAAQPQPVRTAAE